MCRILAVENPQTPKEIADWLQKFADMAKKSPAPPDDENPEGSPQINGWGMSLIFEQSPKPTLRDELIFSLCRSGLITCYYPLSHGILLLMTSLEPVWKQAEQIAQILEKKSDELPKAKMLAHARAASKKEEIGNIDLNMPFKMEVDGEVLSFAFNGSLKVHLPSQLREKLGLPGLQFEQNANGAQRLRDIIAALVKKNKKDNPGSTLQEIVVLSLKQLEAALRSMGEKSGESKKISTITGCNIVIQGPDFTVAVEIERDVVETDVAKQQALNDYYTFYRGYGYAASAEIPNSL